MNEILVISNVSFNYSGIKALESIDFSVNKGDFLGIIGPNGSGKSTLLKILSKSLKLSKGSVLLEDESVYNMKRKELARRMAFVPEETIMNFPFTCFEIVLMGRTPYIERFSWEKPEDFRIAEEAMKQTGTLQFKSRDINELSAGEKQRVIIARALAQKPDILLLDEPTSHLDISHQKEIFDLLKKLNLRDGLTIITVLHDINLASVYCDDLIFLNEGRIFIKGSPQKLITAENIKKIYGIEVLVNNNPSTGTPGISIIPDKIERS